jgi:hypothetical protein
VLLGTSFEKIAEGIATYAGRSDVTDEGRFFFIYTFTPQQERGILQRIRDLVESD